MSIRYRLLLIVGLVSTIIYVFAFILNSRLLEDNFIQIKKQAVTYLDKSYAERRVSIEQFLYEELSKKLAQINAILETMTQYPSLSQWFAPTSENMKYGTWSNASYFLQDEDWIQFLQNTVETDLLSLIVPESGPFLPTKIAPFQEGVSWVSINGSSAYLEPCIGVELPFKEKPVSIQGDSIDIIESTGLPSVYVLYKVERLKELKDLLAFSYDPSHYPDPSLQGYEVDELKFAENLKKAIALAQSPDLPIASRQKEPVKAEETPAGEPLAEKYLKENLDYSSQLFLIGEVTALQRKRVFTGKGGETLWPDAISSFQNGSDVGSAFFLKSVLNYSHPYFNDIAYFEKFASPGESVAKGCSVIKSPHKEQAFFANTAALYAEVNGQKKRSLVTIGFDMSEFMYTISSIAGNYGCLISQGQILADVIPKGASAVNFGHLLEIFKEETAPQGYFNLGDTEYFFFKIYPDESLDLYFCFFTKKKAALGLFMQVQAKIKEILENAWKQKVILEICSLLILWILLLDLSKKITRPIVALSKSLKFVRTGEWDRIKVPQTRGRKNNEVDQLIQSFHEMIEGMKEKEKMSGILNKVVSKEIASEILKGDVHLGGEEKVVTMLFVDIRGFTNLTQNMAPHDTINLLNTCMTKLSQVIEEHKGVIDKYLGDGIMALYGAPVGYANSPLHAVVSALEMIEIIRKWDEERVQEGQPPLEVGIGIHTGTVCAGNMGALNRLNYTVIGSHVNMASRLCFAAGPGEILITADTYLDPCIVDHVEVEDKGFVSFKGFDEKKQVYKVVKLKDTSHKDTILMEGEE